MTQQGEAALDQMRKNIAKAFEDLKDHPAGYAMYRDIIKGAMSEGDYIALFQLDGHWLLRLTSQRLGVVKGEDEDIETAIRQVHDIALRGYRA